MIRIREQINGIGGIRRYKTNCPVCKVDIIFSNTMLPPYTCACQETLPSFERLWDNLDHRVRFHSAKVMGSKYKYVYELGH